MIHSPRFTVVLDACVLYPAPIRDLLLNLAQLGLFKPRWSDEIQNEWIEGLLKKRPDLSRLNLAKTKEAMNSGFRMPEPDPGDAGAVNFQSGISNSSISRFTGTGPTSCSPTVARLQPSDQPKANEFLRQAPFDKLREPCWFGWIGGQ